MRLDLRLAPAAVAAWAAAWFGCLLPPETALAFGCWAGLGAGGLLLVTAVRRPTGGGAAGTLAVAAACLATVLISAGAHEAAREPAGLERLAEERAAVQFEGTVAAEPRTNTSPWGTERVQVTLELRSLRSGRVVMSVAGPVLVVGDSSWSAVRYGERVSGVGTAGLMGSDPVLHASGSPTYRAPASTPLRVVNAMRSALGEAVRPLSPQAQGLVPGLAVGDTSRLEADLDAAMKTTSLTHITAVSGSHFTIVVGVIAAVCSAGRLPRIVRAAITGLTMAGFVLLVHPEPSVIRAAGMGAVGVLGILLRRPSRALPALAAAVIVLLIYDPSLARTYGFALSSVATAGLVLATGPITRRLAPWLGRSIARVVAVPCAAQLACAPLLVLLDPSIAVYSVPANLFAAPALAPATILGLTATLVAPWWPPAATVLAWCASLFTWWIAAVARWFADRPLARISWPGGAGGALLLAGILLAGVVAASCWRRAAQVLGMQPPERTEREPLDPSRLLKALRTRTARTAAVGAVVLALVVAATVPGLVRRLSGPPDDWVVLACDVGQGDALAIRTGDSSALVIDAGPPGDSAGKCLSDAGVRRIDLLVLTHFHADHVGGLPAVLRGRQVRRALVTSDARSDQARSARDRLSAAGVPVSDAAIGVAGDAGAASWTVLQVADAVPTANTGGDESAVNDAGIVLRVDVAGISVLALGDLEEAGQDRLSRAGEAALRADVLKVAHHGSASQSGQLARLVAPRLALFSVGENSYGHPTQPALKLYREAVERRTDRCGAVWAAVRDGGLVVSGCQDSRDEAAARAGRSRAPGEGAIRYPSHGH